MISSRARIYPELHFAIRKESAAASASGRAESGSPETLAFAARARIKRSRELARGIRRRRIDGAEKITKPSVLVVCAQDVGRGRQGIPHARIAPPDLFAWRI